MQPYTVPGTPLTPRSRTRTALVASADRSFRNRLTETLTGLRWHVQEAEGGAEAWVAAASAPPEAVIVDSWLPDLELAEFLRDFAKSFPHVEMLTTGSEPIQASPEAARSPYRQELLYALRRCQDTDSAAWNTAPAMTDVFSSLRPEPLSARPTTTPLHETAAVPCPSCPPSAAESKRAELVADASELQSNLQAATQNGTVPTKACPVARTETGFDGSLLSASVLESAFHASPSSLARRDAVLSDRLPELIGNSPSMLDVGRRIRLVAPRITPVLIEGPTGSGKELVAEGLHRLSSRSRKPFVAINCAAIPEALLEAELFGHTRGAFTGAVQGRIGRIESADGGTLFLDEIGEMPLALQSKLLRFVESGVLQKIGDNETVKVDVRILAATHQPLSEHAQAGSFRADLYYRLAVFLIRTPSLRQHIEDLPLLVAHFLEQMGREAPIKRIDQSAFDRLQAHEWPGNVRELEHVLERAAILAGDETTITAREIDFGFSLQ